MGTSLLPRRIEGIASPRPADERTLRLCFSEADAIAASVCLSRLTYREIAARMGIGKSQLNRYAKGQRTLPAKRTQAFQNATGTLLITQYREYARALSEAAGRVPERVRMARIVAPTLQAWEAA